MAAFEKIPFDEASPRPWRIESGYLATVVLDRDGDLVATLNPAMNTDRLRANAALIGRAVNGPDLEDGAMYRERSLGDVRTGEYWKKVHQFTVERDFVGTSLEGELDKP